MGGMGDWSNGRDRRYRRNWVDRWDLTRDEWEERDKKRDRCDRSCIGGIGER